jgi:hypothetical protein
MYRLPAYGLFPYQYEEYNTQNIKDIITLTLRIRIYSCYVQGGSCSSQNVYLVYLQE